MALRDELEAYVQGVVDAQWTRRDWRKVPDPEDLTLSDTAVELDATVLYADLARSTVMVKNHSDWFAAEAYKTYLYCAARIIRTRGGVVTAYDGDRVMGVFIGDSKNSDAAKCALQINWASKKLVNAILETAYPHTGFTLEQRVGIDTSPLFIARTGTRGSNDLVWVGEAANNAAKMAALDPIYPSYVTAEVYSRLNAASKYADSANQTGDMWTNLGTSDLGYRIYGSTYHWEL